MLVELQNPVLLSRAVEIISELVTEVRIKVNEFGMSIVAMDPANVSMVGFKIPRSAFSKFELDKEILGVNLEDLKRILKRCGSGGSMVMQRVDNTLQIQIYDRIKRNFSLNLIEIESEDRDLPQLEFSSRVEIDSQDLIDCVEDSAVVADACTLKIEADKFVIEAKGINSSRAEFSGDQAKIQAENSKSRYSLEYLQKFMKGAKLCDTTLLQFGSDHPLRVDFRTDNMELTFILAPRVETEN